MGVRLPEPIPRRTGLVVQADSFDRRRLRTTVGIVLTSNTRLLDVPGNVLLPKTSTGLPKDSVASVRPETQFRRGGE
jgi:mRNA interferase MazF